MSQAISIPADTSRVHNGRFFVVMASICVATAFIGFVPSYWLPVLQSQAQPFLIHVHGILFFSWTLFFLLQTSLVASGKVAQHRELGLAGIALAAVMFCVGLLMTIRSLHANTAMGFADAAKAFSIVSFTAIILFACLVGFAIANIRSPATHKRLMLIATVGMLQPAIARWFLLFLRPADAVGPPPVQVTIGPALLVDVLLIVAMIHDKKTRGRVHVAYWIGGGALVAVQVLRVPLSKSVGWLAIANWLSTLSL